MDIAFVSNVVYPFVQGGAQKRIFEIGTRLADSHDVTIYGRQFWDGPRKTMLRNLTLHGVSPACELYTDDRRSIPEAVEFAKDVTIPLRRHVSKHDVIIASVFPYFPVLAAKLGSLFSHTPLVTTWHEVWGTYWENYLGRLAPAGKIIEHLSAAVPQHPVAVSSMTADSLARVGPIGPARDDIAVVPNGIDSDRIQSTSPASDGFDVLFVGRLIPEKNVELLLRAFEQVDRNITLGVIGDGPEFNLLQRCARRLNSRDRITFLGFVDEYAEVLSHMQAADVFVSPSNREGFGITLVEAMAADCTVIAVDAPHSAASEVIENGGFLVDSTEEAIAGAIHRAIGGKHPPQDPQLVAEEYDWDTIAEQALDIYRDAVKHSSKCTR
jgi:glycosyltransferase involved in cell wall biosynthesis